MPVGPQGWGREARAGGELHLTMPQGARTWLRGAALPPPPTSAAAVRWSPGLALSVAEPELTYGCSYKFTLEGKF